MQTVMRARIIQIGNSQGIRIPRLLLEQLRFGDEVELEARDDQLVIRSARSPRQDWDQQFAAMAQAGDDRLLDLEASPPTEWDKTEWEW